MIGVDTLQPPRNEFGSRVRLFAEQLERLNVPAAVLFDPHRVMYYSGFAFYPTERPVAAIVTQDREVSLFVPRLEREHAEHTGHATSVVCYDEYPGERPPLAYLADWLAARQVAGRLAADQDGYPWVYGYSGPALSEVTGAEVVNVAAIINGLMSIKSDHELALIRESMRWSNLGHALLQKYTRVGASELEVSQRAGVEATQAMRTALGATHKANTLGFFGDGVLATYRGQVGRQSSLPHVTTTDARFSEGDTLVTGATAPVWGYYAELERTMFLGEATAEQRAFFQHMLNAQDIAFEALRPGTTAAAVDRAVRAYYEREKLTPYWRHHTGHGLGSRNHEWPFLDTGSDVTLEVGMVFSVEPGFYHPDLGGFRHSDTVVITEAGCQRLSYYPRDLTSLTLSA